MTYCAELFLDRQRLSAIPAVKPAERILLEAELSVSAHKSNRTHVPIGKWDAKCQLAAALGDNVGVVAKLYSHEWANVRQNLTGRAQGRVVSATRLS